MFLLLIDDNLHTFFLSNRMESVKKEKTIGKCFVCDGKALILSPEKNRNVAQLVAYYVRDVGVGRSSRLIPTCKKGICLKNRYLFLFSTPVNDY